jgi:PAS domain S-box-containing protein
LPPPIEISIWRANDEQYEGMIVRVNARVTSKWVDGYGEHMCLRKSRDAKDSIAVFRLFRHKPGFDFSKYKEGDFISVTGVLGQFSRDGSLDTGYEIFPRYPSDIYLLETPVRTYLMIFYSTLGVLVLVLFWVLMLRRQVKNKTRALSDSENRFRSIFEGTNDAILVLRDDLIIENANSAACSLCSMTREDLATKPLSDIFQSEHIPEFKSRSLADRGKAAFEFEMTFRNSTKANFQLLAKMNVFVLEGAQRVVLVLRDITERKHAEKEREDLINKLTDALAEVRALSGLLPICSSCKKIRDDKGYWKQLEEYFYSHSDVRFSHGMCPDCFSKAYPTFTKMDK